jgi:cytochrome c oxidase subunit 2
MREEGVRPRRAAGVEDSLGMPQMLSRLPRAIAATGAALMLAAPALADAPVGVPVPWGMGLQPSGGPIKDAIASFNDLLFVIIVGISVFVLALLAWCVWRYREEANPVPSKTSHNTTLEIVWTVVPVLILIVIAIPSFRLIYYQDRAVNADMTINVQGRQWYWHYAYPDHGNFNFDSYPVADEDLRPGQLRNLEVDNQLVIPVGANVRILTTGQDVIHSFFVPSLGVQKYTIPGRTLETWMRADRAGVFYGQCNQICGVNHWFMPIAVRAVPQAEFEAWAAQARTRFAQGLPPLPVEQAVAAQAAAGRVAAQAVPGPIAALNQ